MAQNPISSETILSFLASRPDGATEGEMAEALGSDGLPEGLAALAAGGDIERRENAGIPTWYPLAARGIQRILVVEDDENINDLMKKSIGAGYEFAQAFDGDAALAKLATFKPDLVLLDLMMPGPDGIAVCRKIKSDAATRDTVVVIVSAADERRNRYVSLKEGADYYIKKPFEPKQLKALVTLFLRKRGRRFDPLVDIPDAAHIAAEIKRAVEGAEEFEVTTLRAGELDDFRRDYGEQEAGVVLRLVSQIVQDKVSEWGAGRVFAGYLGEGEFVLCGGKNEERLVLDEVRAEFERVLPFIVQSTEIRGMRREHDRMDLYELLATGGSGRQVGARISLSAEIIPTGSIIARSEAINKRDAKTDLNQYTLDQLRELLDATRMDFTVSSTPAGVKLSMSPGEPAQDGKGR